jgi:hypothetical protein
MTLTLFVKMNDEPTSYIREIKRVKEWRISGDILHVALSNGDNVYIIKDYIVSIDESKEV